MGKGEQSAKIRQIVPPHSFLQWASEVNNLPGFGRLFPLIHSYNGQGGAICQDSANCSPSFVPTMGKQGEQSTGLRQIVPPHSFLQWARGSNLPRFGKLFPLIRSYNGQAR